MEFHDETKPLYLKTDVSEIGLGAALLQTRDGTTCPKDITPDNIFSGPSHLQAKARPALNRGTATLRERHWVYCMCSKNSPLLFF